MITVETRIIGDEDVRQRFLDTGSRVRNKIRAAMMSIGEEIQAQARAAAPVLTGRLRNSIKLKLLEQDGRIKVRVGPPIFYGKFLEFGVVNHGGLRNANERLSKLGKVHRVRDLRARGQWRIAPRPFMAPAIERITARINPSLDAALAAAVSES